MQEAEGVSVVGAAGQPPMLGSAADPMRECILLAACGANELLPQSPDLPADVFTSCLTTPIKVRCRSCARRVQPLMERPVSVCLLEYSGRQAQCKS